MDKLLLVGGPHHHRPLAPGSHAVPATILFRSPSSARDLLSGDASEDSEALTTRRHNSASAPNRIAMAKAILAEACLHGCTTKIAWTAPPGSPNKLGDSHRHCPTTGPLSSLLALLHATPDPQKACCCLNTLSFLLLDRANRKVVADLHGVSLVLEVMRKHQDPQVNLSALETAVALVKHVDNDKAMLWLHDDQCTIISLLSAKASTPHMLELLRLIKKVAFTSDAAGPVQLLEPRLIPAVASLLHPAADASLLQLALKLLQTAAMCSEPSLLAAWQPAVFSIVPLLLQQPCMVPGQGSDPAGQLCSDCILSSVLQTLLSLSDHEAFRNALFAAGCITPLLPLLSHSDDSIKLSTTCILANLVESGLCRQHLAQDAAVRCILNALHVASCSEATVGLLYVLGQLATDNSHAVSLLRKFGTAPLSVMMQCCPEDKDVLLGIQQLLELMQGTEPEEEGPGAGQAPAVGATLRTVDSDIQICSIVDRQKQYFAGMPRALTQTASSSSIVNLCAYTWF